MDPIRPDLIEKMNGIGKILGDNSKPYGFTLLVFDYGDSGYMNYISNANREDMIAAMKEFIAKHEGRSHDAPKTKQ